MAGTLSVQDESPVHLCTNSKCFNNDVSEFTEKQVCGEHEQVTIMVCKLCQEEIIKDAWEHTREALFPTPRRTRKLKKAPYDENEPAPIISLEDNAESEPKLLYDINKNFSDDFGTLNLDESGAVGGSDSVSSPPEFGHMTREFSVDSIENIISVTPCTTCKQVLERVSSRDDPLSLWYCSSCDAYFGVDDSFTMRDMYDTMNILAESLETATLRTTGCRGGDCDNDDPNQFVFEVVDQELYLICKKCDHLILIADADQDETASSSIVTESEEPSPKSIAQIQIRCDCGNDNPNAFAVQYHSSGNPAKLVCHVCDAELVLDLELARDGPLEKGTVDDQLTFHPPKGRTEIGDVKALEPGDHIGWHQSLAYWHHAVVVRVGDISGKVRVIHYDGPEKQYGGKGVIVEDWLEIDTKKEALYRFDYEGCNTADVVLERARERLGETKYDLFHNNCEHFAQWCKTGVARSEQVESFAETVAHVQKKIMMYASKDSVKTGIKLVKVAAQKYRAISRRMAGSTVPRLGQATTDVAKNDVTKAASSLGKLDYAAIGLVIGIEACRTGNDIYKMHQKKEKGDISHGEFVRFTVKRTTQGVGGVAGTVAGGAIGQVLIPIPVVGSLAGATLGAFIGEGVGAVLGRKLIKGVEGK